MFSVKKRNNRYDWVKECDKNVWLHKKIRMIFFNVYSDVLAVLFLNIIVRYIFKVCILRKKKRKFKLIVLFCLLDAKSC